MLSAAVAALLVGLALPVLVPQLSLLGPTTLFVLTITMIRAVRVFDTVKVLTQGGPNKASEVLLHAMYLEGFTYFRLGYSAAITLVFLAIVLALMWLQTRVLDKRVHYG